MEDGMVSAVRARLRRIDSGEDMSKVYGDFPSYILAPQVAADRQFLDRHGTPEITECELETIKHQPELGQDDVSKCLPGWIKTLCDAHASGNGITLSAGAVSSLCHTLIGARIRQHRLIRERDAIQVRVD